MIRVDSRKEPKFTQHYSQPETYHFCHESVILAETVVDRLPSSLPKDFRALDIGAGCGVVGLELCHLKPELPHVDFLEVQTEFEPHFRHNHKVAGRSNYPDRWLAASFSSLSNSNFESTYDLIVSNPPYFFEGEGPLGNDQIRNRSRFFLDGSLEEMVRGINSALKPFGAAYFLLRPGFRHGRDALEVVRGALGPSASASLCAEIRGTWLIEIKKSNR